MATKNGIAIAAAFIGGAVVGAAAGLLFAPCKGEDQRRRIKLALERSGVHIKNNEQLNKLIDNIKEACTPGSKADPAEDFDVE